VIRTVPLIQENAYVMALLFGAFSALSLPIGAMIGIWTKPSKKVTSAIMSFGAGALLAAIAFELVKPALEREGAGFLQLAIGVLVGCGMFISLSRMLDSQGAFKRKRSTLMAHIMTRKKKKLRGMISELSKVDFLRALPAHQIQAIVPYVEEHRFPKGYVVFEQDNFGDAMYIIKNGNVRIECDDAAGSACKVAELGPGETFGEMALLWNAPRSARAITENDVDAWEIHKDDFDLLMSTAPELRAAVSRLAEERMRTGKLPKAVTGEKEWAKEAIKSFADETLAPTTTEIKLGAKREGKNAAMAIWLGTFLDGIPESLVIGASMVGTAISPALIGGLFIANLPESMSSATIMKQGGAKNRNIFLLWFSLVIAVGVGAMLGNLFCRNLPAAAKSMFEGIAGGSMLTMTAQTMLPEAYEQNVWTVGIFTVLGFLAALFFHTLNPVA
jgi:CRP-like cAMP-binding protein